MVSSPMRIVGAGSYRDNGHSFLESLRGGGKRGGSLRLPKRPKEP